MGERKPGEPVQWRALLHLRGKVGVTSVMEGSTGGSSVAQSIYSLHTYIL